MSQNIYQQDSCFNTRQIQKIMETIDELTSCNYYVEELEDFNKSSSKKITGLERENKSLKRDIKTTDKLQNETGKQSKAIRFQRNIFGGITGILAVVLIVLII